jgi:hypothetical protein
VSEQLYNIYRHEVGSRKLGTWYCYSVGAMSPKKFIWLTAFDILDMNADSKTRGSSSRIVKYSYDTELANATMATLSLALPKFYFRLVLEDNSGASLTFNIV